MLFTSFPAFVTTSGNVTILTSTIVFTVRKIAYSTTGKELSEIKSFGIVKQYFSELYKNIFRSKVILHELFQRISRSIQRYGIKSKKKEKKTAIKILQTMKMTESVLIKMGV